MRLTARTRQPKLQTSAVSGGACLDQMPSKVWTAVHRDCEQIRIDMQTLFGDLGLSAVATAA